MVGSLPALPSFYSKLVQQVFSELSPSLGFSPVWHLKLPGRDLVCNASRISTLYYAPSFCFILTKASNLLFQ